MIERTYDQGMGPRRKASDALAAWNGDRPSLGDRVDATREAAAEVMAQQEAAIGPEPAPAQPGPPLDPRPMPPDGADGSWVWVTSPTGGVDVARAHGWIRVTPDELSPGGWALRVMRPRWVALSSWTGAGGMQALAAEEGEVVPSSRVERIPGWWVGAPREGDDRPDS